jgi:transcription elongation factor Elf1
MRQDTEKLYGIPLWDLHSCDICGSVLLASTIQLHAQFHQTQVTEKEGPKFATKNCPVCGVGIEMPLDIDGAMILDVYDDHLETHEE